MEDKIVLPKRKMNSCSNLRNLDKEFETLMLQELKKYQKITFPDDVPVVEFDNMDLRGSSSSSSGIEELNEEWAQSELDNTFYVKTSKKKSGSNIFSKKFSFSTLINNLFENPEGKVTNTQKMTIVVFSCFEAYRTVISSFLIVFVPQKCEYGLSCTILQNLLPTDDIEVAAISINTFMALYFCGLFAIERIRETTIKTYLIADKSAATDKEYLIQMLSSMNEAERNKILWINRLYRKISQFLLLLFFINAGISCVVIRKNYLNNTTVTVFITNTLFMINRIYKAIKTTSSGEYNIYSAYLSDSVLYNRNRSGWLQKETFSHMV
jgi:hypothetical protein